MSDFDSFIRIENNFPFDLNGGAYEVSEGSFIKDFPRTIKAGTAHEIHVIAEISSEGQFRYHILFGDILIKVEIKFACTDFIPPTFVAVRSSAPHMAGVVVTEYSKTRPLKATVAILEPNQE